MEKMEPAREIPHTENRIETIVTHEGLFHTDEVFATAILKDLFPESMELKAGGKVDFVKYIRTRDENAIAAYKDSPTALVHDTGGENDIEMHNHDHHQIEGGGSRENGINYATAGLIWKYFGKEWIKYIDVYSRHLKKNDVEIGDNEWIKHIDKNAKHEEFKEEEIDLIWQQVDENYVQYMDANDTGQMESVTCTLSNGRELNGKTFSLSEIIRLNNIDTRDGRIQQDRFDESVATLGKSMNSAVHKYMDLVEGLQKFKKEKCEFISNNRAVLINQNLDPVVNSYIIDTKNEFKNVEYFAALNERGGYSIMVAPLKEGLRKYRNSAMIPMELRLGNNNREINKILGINDGVIFSHVRGFFASCKNAQTAKKFLEYCTK